MKFCVGQVILDKYGKNSDYVCASSYSEMSDLNEYYSFTYRAFSRFSGTLTDSAQFALTLINCPKLLSKLLY